MGSFIDRQGLPSVRLGRFAATTWENLVEAFQDFAVQRNFRGTQGGLQLLDDSGTDNRRHGSSYPAHVSRVIFEARVRMKITRHFP
jgi:hypothetical protein